MCSFQCTSTSAVSASSRLWVASQILRICDSRDEHDFEIVRSWLLEARRVWLRTYRDDPQAGLLGLEELAGAGDGAAGAHAADQHIHLLKKRPFSSVGKAVSRVGGNYDGS